MNAMLTNNRLSMRDKIRKYFEDLDYSVFIHKNEHIKDRKIAEFIGQSFHKRMLADRNIYFGPYFQQIDYPLGYDSDKYIYYATKENQPNALPDFFLMMYQNNNLKYNKNVDDILRPISIFYYKYIHNVYPKKYKNIDYTTCTQNDLNDKLKLFNKTNNIQSYFKWLHKITINNEKNNVPNRVSSTTFQHHFGTIIDGTYVPALPIDYTDCCVIL